MKKPICILIIANILLSMIPMMGCDVVQPDIKIDTDTTTTVTEPPEPPPPPPPPPGLSCGGGASSSSAPELTVDMIAEKVLRGDYGPELQSLLAAEVAACLTQMSIENVVTISQGARIEVRSVEAGKGSVMFNYGCIEEDVLGGAYGMDVREALHALVRGSKTEKL